MTFAATLASLGSIATAPVGTAPGYMARAWVNFNGTGTVAIRASGNVSSITDLATGQYRANFTTSMPDTNYCTIGFGIPQFDAAERTKLNSYTASYVDIYNATMNNTYYDSSQLMVAVFR